MCSETHLEDFTASCFPVKHFFKILRQNNNSERNLQTVAGQGACGDHSSSLGASLLQMVANKTETCNYK